MVCNELTNCIVRYARRTLSWTICCLNLSSSICGSFNSSHDIVALAEEGVPVVQGFLLGITQIVPVRSTLLRLERGLC
jgi:hypothetical protein